VLSDRIDDVHESLRKGETPEVYKAEEGRVFLWKLILDYEKLRKLIEENDLLLDRRGWIAVDLFPITIEILNRELSPGSKVYVGHGRYKICVVYYGISPELENFVVTCLWPKDAGTSKLAYRKIYDIVKTDLDLRKVIRFVQDFGLEPPNLIHPFNDRRIEAIVKPKSVYEWQSVPYLTEIGNTLLSHKSPVNFQKIFIDSNNGRLSTYVNVKCSIGSFLEIRREEARILVPSLFSGNLAYQTRITPDVFSQIRTAPRFSLYHILIQESAEENITRTIFKIVPATPPDVVSTLLLFSMYQLFLGSRRLLVMSTEHFAKLFRLCVEKTFDFCHSRDSGSQFWTPDTFFTGYLSPFFRKIGNNIFYVPHFLNALYDSMLEKFDDRLMQGKNSISDGLLFGEGGAYLNKAVLGRKYQMLRFLIDAKRFSWWSSDHEFVYQALRHVLFQ
jgi:hypothetical protein